MKKLWTLGFLAALSLSAANLVSNPEFKLDNGRLSGFSRPDAAGVWSAKDGVLTLSENHKKYTSAISCDIPVDGFRSYKVSFEGKPEKLSKMAGVYYYWVGKDGKLISKARFIKQYRNSADYTVSSAVLTPDEPAKTAKLRICFAIYHAENGTGVIHFRKPSVEAVDAKSAVNAPVAPAVKKK